ncbi:TIR domain-containing protein [Paraburkholderia sp. SOS3]|uniref:TIR domain-containing protein n=1 Tax=Paraburkholderia sp. SOS3 TaxID=1926494 RepID=UPI000947353F|nr:TIR domain-containing protein [Paraburkholderia sp. SOS3]APR36717.1 hypothetical protein BTO02_16370 [Paraburkholderia sp. SOS3]
MPRPKATAAKKTSPKKAMPVALTEKRTYLKQSDVPSASLEEALRVPEAIIEHYAGRPTAPLYVAKALNVDPGGSQLKVLSGASIAFGLIEGGAQAASMTVTDLARRILRPKKEGDDLLAKRESILLPRVIGEFLRRYDGSTFPRNDIAMNVLEELGVPREKTAEVMQRIESSARSIGLLEEIRGKLYVSLNGSGSTDNKGSDSARDEHEDRDPTTPTQDRATQAPEADAPELAHPANPSLPPAPSAPAKSTALATAIADDERRRKVFITHGKSRELVDPIKRLLEFGELHPIVSVERQTVSKPVPEKVMDDMRACGAAIIHVDADRTVTDHEGVEHVLLNPNVLIEIGAAMAFYGRRFILLVRDGVKLPSNLQGLYEVRYTNDTLDANATIKLLEAIKDIKNHSLPNDDQEEA